MIRDAFGVAITPAGPVAEIVTVPGDTAVKPKPQEVPAATACVK